MIVKHIMPHVLEELCRARMRSRLGLSVSDDYTLCVSDDREEWLSIDDGAVVDSRR